MSFMSVPLIPGVIPTQSITAATQAVSVNTQYYASNPSTRIVFTLPATANSGDKVYIRGSLAGGWRIAQNSGQTIHGSSDTTTGASGYIESQTKDDCVSIECMPGSNGTDWKVFNHRGTLTYG